VRLSGLLRPLIQREWARLVARWNRDASDEARLEDFLFGVERIPLGRVRDGLREVQDNRCFYCGGTIRGSADVDHFIPWARYPDNGLDNLIVSDQGYNNAKRDHLAATEHLCHWTERFHVPDLDQLALEVPWDRHRELTLSVARGIYLRLPSTISLWLHGREFVKLDRSLVESLLVRGRV
jgi:hypothetical protein